MKRNVDTVYHIDKSYVLAVILVEVRDVLDNLFVGELLERLLASKRQYLPEGYSERPHVALRRKFAL